MDPKVAWRSWGTLVNVIRFRNPHRRSRKIANLDKRSEAEQANPQNQGDTEDIDGEGNSNDHSINISDTEDIDGEGNSNDHSINISDTEDIDGKENSNDHSINISGFTLEGNSEDVGREEGSSQKVWIFLIVNLVVELLSAAFDLLSSKQNPQYALVAMLMAFVGLLACIAELAFKGVKERVSWRWDRKIPWFYSSTTPTNYRCFGTCAELFGLVCAIVQSILSTIAYVFL
ncbi:hypothetical protein REPUB_Repub04eG0025000 [Reevesia pubescens]